MNRKRGSAASGRGRAMPLSEAVELSSRVNATQGWQAGQPREALANDGAQAYVIDVTHIRTGTYHVVTSRKDWDVPLSPLRFRPVTSGRQGY